MLIISSCVKFQILSYSFSIGPVLPYILLYLLQHVFVTLSYFNFRNGIKPNMLAPRVFCDICDMFDLHDTEDCPRQAMESPPPPTHGRHGVGKKRVEERPYCEICESE